MTIDEVVKTVRNTDGLYFYELTNNVYDIGCVNHNMNCTYCPLSMNNTPDSVSYCGLFNPKEIYDHLREHYPEELV